MYVCMYNIGITYHSAISSALERVSKAELLDSYRIWLGRARKAPAGQATPSAGVLVK
jgi:hypothetical protein